MIDWANTTLEAYYELQKYNFITGLWTPWTSSYDSTVIADEYARLTEQGEIVKILHCRDVTRNFK